MKLVIYILIFALSTSLFAQDDQPIEVPQIAVKMKLKESVQFDGITVLFKEVLSDSRCPKNVECIWAGEAKVLVSITNDDGEVVDQTITFKNGLAIIAAFFNTELQFLKLTPYPDANISKEDIAPYALLVKTN